MKLEPKDRVYKLTRDRAPLSTIIPAGGSPKKPILYFDESQGINREIRYASNQKSIFVDEQDGLAQREHIDFIDGLKVVPKTNPALQKFLHLHPLNGKLFEEINDEKDAADQLEQLDVAFQAESEARKLTITQLENIARVFMGINPDKLSTKELKRDLLIKVANSPIEFLKVINDPMLKLQSQVHLFFDKGLLSFRKNQKEVWFNLKTNKTKLLTVPFGEDPFFIVASYFQSDDGIESLKLLEKILED